MGYPTERTLESEPDPHPHLSREDLASKQKMDPQLQELVQEAVNVSESPYKLVNNLLVRPVTNDYGIWWWCPKS